MAERNNGIVYTSIDPSKAVTSRMASQDPNLQNVPTLTPRRGRTAGGENPVRSCFICRPGFTNYYFDYEQMEIAAFGLYTGEEIILDTYAAGKDIHAAMAVELYGKDYDEQLRDRTKDTNYGIIYGMGVAGMAKARGVSRAKAQEFLDFYQQTFSTIATFLDECKYQLKQYGYVQDWFGKRYHVAYHDAYKAVNCLVQGGCAQAFKVALLNLDEYLAPSEAITRIILLSHDEFMIERKTGLRGEKAFVRRVCKIMSEIDEFTSRGLTLRVDVKKSETNWAEKKPLEV